MPWTFAHPAAVLPLRRLCPQHLSFAGLVIGSLTPDIGYYIGHVDLGAKTHTPAGILVICLPVGLALFLLVRLLHRPVAHLLPQPHRGALISLPQLPSLFEPRPVGVVVTSLLLGALTHVGWDAFTHRTGYFVLHLDLLKVTLFQLGGREIHVYNALQHASTIIGCLLLAISYARFVRIAGTKAGCGEGSEAHRYLLLAMFGLVSLAGAVPLAYADAASGGSPINGSVLVVRTVVYATTVFAALVVVAAAWVAYRRRA